MGTGLAVAALIGCGDGDEIPGAPQRTPTATSTPTPGTTPAPAPEGPRQGGRFGYQGGVPLDSFNPVTNWQQGNNYVGVHVYDRLLSARIDDRRYVLEAAERIEMPDETTVIAQLKPGLVYQDRPPVNGRPVLSEDIVVTQEYIRDEPNAIFGTFQQNSMEVVEAPDDRTVIFRLRRPSAYLFTGSELSNGGEQCIIPRELVTGDLDNTEPIGSGPYQQKEFQHGVRYLYERNPTFRDSEQGLPYIDERLGLPITDTAALEAAFRGEQIQRWIPTPDIADRLTSDLGDRLTVVEVLALNLVTWNMSSRRDTFNDIRVREAMYRAFEPTEYINLTLNGWGVEVSGQLAAGLTRYQLEPNETAEYKRHDPQQARQLLDASGFDLGRTYEITTISGAVNESNVSIYQEQLRRVGVQTTITSLPGGEWLANKARSGEFDFNVVGHPGYDSPQTPLRLHHTESRNVNAWVNLRDPEVDALIEESETLLDPDSHVALVKQIQLELLRRYANTSYVYTPIQREIYYAYLKDWETNLADQPMYRTEAWLDV